MKRRSFIRNASLFAIAPTFLVACRRGHVYPVSLEGNNSNRGHLIREKFTIPEELVELQHKIVIVGGGVSGLSAGWALQKAGETDFMVAELADQLGGNSVSGSNAAGKYPWGAHYLPIPNRDYPPLLEFLKEARVISQDGKELNSEYLLHEPMERLYIHGKWQEGLVPSFGLNKNEALEIQRFFSRMNQFKDAQGNDGKRLFAVPLEFSSHDPEILQLDQITFHDWLKENDFESSFLRWYLDYCMRDDYGGLVNSVSAWAGIHYFASRYGKFENTEESHLLTWPEGNSFLVDSLKKPYLSKCETGWIARHIEVFKDGFKIYFQNLEQKKNYSVIAQKVILALPVNVISRIAKDILPQDWLDKSQYLHSPWMVGNILINSDFFHSINEEVFWDNVMYSGKSLGYVHTKHQLIQTKMAGKTTFTWYQPLTDDSPSAERKIAHKNSPEDWKRILFSELKRMHPEIENYIELIEFKIWGHGIILPIPNLIWGKNQQQFRKEIIPNLFFAHTDFSGISIFEQAFYQGFEAATRTMSA